ncbi:hypothetical protein DRJ12_04975 [Candidatus Acetothermia bacterium]|nr:MAG: hypothetical protein DRJ12_04975 [Candidatus Acetothermia bacterium]
MRRSGSIGLVILSSVFLSIGVIGSTPSSLIKEADHLYDRWSGGFDLVSYGENLKGAISLYETALAALPEESLQTRAYVLNRLARAEFELGFAYLTDRDELEAAYTKGKDYALASLRLDPAFRKTEEESFRAALAGANDLDAIFWYGNNLGRYLEFHPLAAVMGGMKDVRASFERAIELDPTYLDGGPWRALGSFLAQVPSALGGDIDRAEEALRNAIAAGAGYLENEVDLAEYVMKPKGDTAGFCSLLKEVLAEADDPEVTARWPLYNALAVKRARDLLADRPCD